MLNVSIVGYLMLVSLFLRLLSSVSMTAEESVDSKGRAIKPMTMGPRPVGFSSYLCKLVFSFAFVSSS